MAGTPMQGMHSLWYDHYKGAVYPLDLEGLPCCKHKNAVSSTLLEACCAYIVKDSTLTKAAIDTVPPILCIHMMECALRGNHDRAIQALMSHWSMRSLVLSKLVPSVFSSLLPLYDSVYQSDLVRQGLRYTTSLAHTFLECLRQEKPTKIRYLDLTGFPTAEVILYYLTSHCMLVHNESRRNNMINLYNQAVHLVEECDGEPPNQHSILDIDVHNCIPKDISIEIKLDAFVTSESCHSELCKALTVSGFPEARFRLCVEKLSVTCLGGDRVNLLLKQVKPQHLKGLQLKYNSLRNTDFLLMAPTLQSFTKLTCLDLSCNHLSLYGNEPLSIIMRQAFCTLVNLERLDLSNNRIKTKLGSVLQGVVAPLKHLRLAGCGLTPGDISSLSRFPFLESLQELDLSENGLTPSYTSLANVLQKASSSLRLLELEDSALTDEVAIWLATSLLSLKNLLYLNISGNSWSTSTSEAVVNKVVNLFVLKVVRLSYSKDCYSEEKEEMEAKEAFESSMMSIVANAQTTALRKERLQLVFTDLERTME